MALPAKVIATIHGKDLASIAVRLLQVRNLCREEPEQPAWAWVDPEEALLIASQEAAAVEGLTIKQFVYRVAQLGGFLRRTSDGSQAGKPSGMAGCACAGWWRAGVLLLMLLPPFLPVLPELVGHCQAVIMGWGCHHGAGRDACIKI